MLWDRFERAFWDLIEAWEKHDEARSRGSAVDVLAESRRRLERARADVTEIRRALAPEARELEDVALVTVCDLLGDTVFLYHADADRTEETLKYRCPCGTAVDAAGAHAA